MHFLSNSEQSKEFVKEYLVLVAQQSVIGFYAFIFSVRILVPPVVVVVVIVYFEYEKNQLSYKQVLIWHKLRFTRHECD